MPALQGRLARKLNSFREPRILYTDALKVQLPEIIEPETNSSSSSDGTITLESSVSIDFLSLPNNITALQSRISSNFANELSASLPIPFPEQQSIQSSVSNDVLPLFAGFPSLEYLDPIGVEISAIYVEPEKAPLPTEVLFVVEPIEQPKLPHNRFQSLEHPIMLGMNYRDRYWRQISLDEIDAEPQKRGSTRPLSKSYLQIHESDRSKKKNAKPRPPSFWDLIYPVLLPPLIINRLRSLYLPHKLFKFQPAGIDFLMQNESALLADEMGTGKTVMTTVALRILFQKGKIDSALIVCPVSVLREWNRHLEDWAPELLATFVRGPRETRELDWKIPAHVFVTTYDTLRSDIDSRTFPRKKLKGFDVVILDEAQSIKNPKSRRSKVIKKLIASRRWALTGTPVENKIEDLASIFEFLRPGYLTIYDLYPERLREKIAPYFLRRRKKDVLPDLPQKQKQDIWLELDPKQRTVYEEATRGVRKELKSKGERVTKVDIFRTLQKLKQICNFHPDKGTSPKVDYLKEQLEDIIESGQKVIVFSQYIGEGINKLENALKAYGIAKLVGGQSDSKRSSEITRFKKQELVPILIASVKAGGVGLNLTEASYVVHFDHWWNPAVMWQAEDRVHRPGQTRGVNIYSYWMVDTIEERIHQVLQRKAQLFGDVVEGLSEGQIDELISLDEWLEILEVKPAEQPKRSAASKKIVQALDPSELLEKLLSLTPKQFEHLVKDLMQSFDYVNAKVKGNPRDGGIDVIASRNTEKGPVRAIAQCKRYKGTVGVKVARELMGAKAANNSIEKAYLVTTGKFSRPCATFCEENGIEAIDGPRLADYVRRLGLPV